MALLGGCIQGGHDDGFEPSCNPPSGVRYTCAPSPAGTRGCTGPRWTTNDGRVMQEDPSYLFAVGCQAQLPACSPFYPGSIRTLTCEDGFGTEHDPTWVEPL